MLNQGICARCNRVLRDAKSQARGLGPVCHRKNLVESEGSSKEVQGEGSSN